MSWNSPSQSRRRFEAIVKSAYDGIISVGLDQRIRMMNDAAMAMFGVTSAAGPLLLETLLPVRFRARHLEYIHEFMASETASRPMQLRGAVIGLRADGTEFPLEVSIAKIQVGSDTEVVAVMRDISERVHMIQDLQIAATVDVLTQALNRRALMEAAQTEFSRSVRFGRAMSVLLFDIDYFKTVNDRFGHAAGDVILKSVVDRARTVLREVDLLGRWGGEEFVAILLELDEDGATRCAERLRQAVASTMFSLADGRAAVPITISVGIATRTEAVGTVDELLARADAAMYRAKNAGRNRISS
ncbi:MAG: GGDEF domain-containing protein [Paucibacter sp.]|nr:GGDEF domain-containing protein [Roseateles sp.]